MSGVLWDYEAAFSALSLDSELTICTTYQSQHKLSNNQKFSELRFKLASLEGGLPRGEHGLLSDDAAAPHRLEEAIRGEDLPVALSQLNGLLAEVLHQDAIPPLPG